MSMPNYKVYIDIGADLMTISKTLAIVYTTTCPGFVCSDIIGPTLNDLMKSGLLPDFCDATRSLYS